MKTIWTVLFGFLCLSSMGQKETKVISLSEAIELAKNQSTDAMIVRNRFQAAYWQYRNFKADLLPNIMLKGTLPSFNRTLSSYLKEDGSQTFISNNSLSEQLSLSISQNIPLTGGRISLQSELERVDQLDGEKKTTYMSIPISISLNQPLISSHPLKWDKRIEPERFKQAKQQFAVEMEKVAIQAINHYFNLLLALINVDIAQQNLEHSSKLVKIASSKKNMGLISDNELLQLKLNQLNASSALIQTQQEYEQKMFALRNYLGYNEQIDIKPEIPAACPDIEISIERVMEIANKNNPFRYDIVCRLLESKQQIAQAKAESGFQADIYATIGYTGSNTTFKRTYQNLQNREAVSLGISIPILNWGKRKGKIELARSREEITKNEVQQSRLNFEQNVITIVRQYQEQRRLNEIVQLADTIAQQRYKTAYETFVMGQISVLDINAAQVERDNAKRNYIHQLSSSWTQFYTLRQLTLFDFELNKDIIYDEFKTLNF